MVARAPTIINQAYLPELATTLLATSPRLISPISIAVYRYSLVNQTPIRDLISLNTPETRGLTSQKAMEGCLALHLEESYRILVSHKLFLLHFPFGNDLHANKCCKL